MLTLFLRSMPIPLQSLLLFFILGAVCAQEQHGIVRMYNNGSKVVFGFENEDEVTVEVQGRLEAANLSSPTLDALRHDLMAELAELRNEVEQQHLTDIAVAVAAAVSEMEGAMEAVLDEMNNGGRTTRPYSIPTNAAYDFEADLCVLIQRH